MNLNLSTSTMITSTLAWLLLSPLILLSLLFVSFKVRYQQPTVFIPKALASSTKLEVIGEAAPIYSKVKGISTDMQVGDARPIILARFLEEHNSPLKPHDYFGQFLVDLADTYAMDYRLLPSISMQESNLCKRIPEGTFNCLGLGIHSQGTWGFERYEDNFTAAAKILKKNYIDKGYVTPDEIQDKYTPGSNGSWEYAVNYFMNILEYADFED